VDNLDCLDNKENLEKEDFRVIYKQLRVHQELLVNQEMMVLMEFLAYQVHQEAREILEIKDPQGKMAEMGKMESVDPKVT